MAAGDRTESRTTGLQELSARIAQLQEELRTPAGNDRTAWKSWRIWIGLCPIAAGLAGGVGSGGMPGTGSAKFSTIRQLGRPLTDQASEILRAITGSERYFGIQVNMPEQEMVHFHGDRRCPHLSMNSLSTGTADQIRMAVCLSALSAAGREPMPLYF